MSFDSLLSLIQKYDPVNAGVVNAPLQQLDQNLRFIYSILQAASLGSTIYARQQTIEAAAVPGMAVWYNPATQRFERGLAVATTDLTTGLTHAAASAQIWGVVATKTNATLADILLSGFTALDLSSAVLGTVTAGVYYLSGTTPGFLTKTRPAVPVGVLRATGDGKVFLVPQLLDVLDRHAHFQFELVCEPAGTTAPPAPEDRHTITDANSLLPGWLPASDASFLGLAPVGAEFGYNLAAHPSLQSAWPPAVPTAAVLEWDRGVEAAIAATLVPIGPDGLVIIDNNGIWWMSDCYDDVPWPTLTDTSENSASWSQSVDAVCPRHLSMRLGLRFTRATF